MGVVAVGVVDANVFVVVVVVVVVVMSFWL